MHGKPQQLKSSPESRRSVSGVSVRGRSAKRAAPPVRSSSERFKTKSELPKSVKSKWQMERAGILLRLCKLIARGSARRKTVRKSISVFARRWRGKTYRSNPAKRLRLSESGLKRAFYRWKKIGNASAFALHYSASGKRLVPPSLLREVLQRSQAVTAISLQGVINGIERDWRKGKRIPGLKPGSRKMRLPFRHSIQRHCRGIDFQKRRAILKSLAQLDAQLRAANFSIAQQAKQIVRRSAR